MIQPRIQFTWDELVVATGGQWTGSGLENPNGLDRLGLGAPLVDVRQLVLQLYWIQVSGVDEETQYIQR